MDQITPVKIKMPNQKMSRTPMQSTTDLTQSPLALVKSQYGSNLYRIRVLGGHMNTLDPIVCTIE